MSGCFHPYYKDSTAPLLSGPEATSGHLREAITGTLDDPVALKTTSTYICLPVRAWPSEGERAQSRTRLRAGRAGAALRLRRTNPSNYEPPRPARPPRRPRALHAERCTVPAAQGADRDSRPCGTQGHVRAYESAQRNALCATGRAATQRPRLELNSLGHSVDWV